MEKPAPKAAARTSGRISTKHPAAPVIPRPRSFDHVLGVLDAHKEKD